MAEQQRAVLKPGRARHIEEGLVDAVLLDGVRVLLQDLDHRPARVAVERVVRRDDDELRALPPCIHDGLTGLNMIFLRRNRLREDDPVTLTLVAAHRTRNRAEIERAAEMVDPIARLPAEKRRINIDMKDNPFHNLSLPGGMIGSDDIAGSCDSSTITEYECESI